MSKKILIVEVGEDLVRAEGLVAGVGLGDRRFVGAFVVGPDVFAVAEDILAAHHTNMILIALDHDRSILGALYLVFCIRYRKIEATLNGFEGL